MPVGWYGAEREELPGKLDACLDALRHEALDPVRSLLAEFWPDALARLKNAVERTHQPEETR